MLREFTMPKAGTKATVDILEARHLPEVLALQNDTRAALPSDQKMFVLPQKPDYFEKLLAHKKGLIVGVRTEGRLVGQLAVMGTLTLDEAVACNAITRNRVPFHHAESTDLIVVLKSMAVHPSWRGNEISQHLLAAALEVPFVRTADHAFAQISVDNARSWELFLKQGFGIVAAGMDPYDDRPRFVLQRPELGFAFHAISTIKDIDAATDFSAIMRMTEQEALVGKLESEGKDMKLAFFASEDTAGAWGETPATLAR